VLYDKLVTASSEDVYEFGCKAKHSTGLCTGILKRTINYYTDRGSHVFCAFIDFSKAFDRVNYWHLFNKLLDDDYCFVRCCQTISILVLSSKCRCALV